MGSMVQGLCLDTQNTPSSQTLYNVQEFVFYINWVIMHSIAKQGQALLLACMQWVCTIGANLSMLPQGQCWWHYDSTEQVCMTDLLIQVSVPTCTTSHCW